MAGHVPPMIRRYRENRPLTAADQSTFYVGGETGYTDYPFFPSHEARGLSPVTKAE